MATAPVNTKDEIEDVIVTLAREPGGSLVVMPDTFNVTNRELIIALTVRYGIPGSLDIALMRYQAV